MVNEKKLKKNWKKFSEQAARACSSPRGRGGHHRPSAAFPRLVRPPNPMATLWDAGRPLWREREPAADLEMAKNGRNGLKTFFRNPTTLCWIKWDFLPLFQRNGALKRGAPVPGVQWRKRGGKWLRNPSETSRNPAKNPQAKNIKKT